MIDLHTHTIFSDGALIPSELIRRAVSLGLRAIAIADHADASNLDFVVPRVIKACEENSACRSIKALPGVELTHLPPSSIAKHVARARELGAKIVVIHGESPVEPVEHGTNRAGIEAGADIIAHPGLIFEEDALLAAKKGVHLEITARKGHSLTNGYVASMARKTGAKLVLDTDAHAPGDLITLQFAKVVALGAGLTEGEFDRIRENMARLAGLAEG